MSADATSRAQPASGLRSLAATLAALACLWLACALLFEVGAPIGSGDLWWHLTLGDTYLERGPWLEADPLLYTAEGPPHPSSWLFDVGVAAIASSAGLGGLRVLHVAAVLAVLALAFALLRRGCRDPATVFLGLAVLVVLMGNRLERLRPELFSMAAVLVLALLLARREPPGWVRVAGASLLIGVWANFHAAFGVGPLLVVAAIAGLVAQLALGGLVSDRGSCNGSLWAQRLGAVVMLGLLVALLNPRGVDQHLSYLISSAGSALQAIGDDWVRFDPLGGRTRAKLGRVAWGTADVLLVAFAACALLASVRLALRRDAHALRRLELPLLALGVASWVAIFSSQRFLWLAIFPLLYVLRALLHTPAARLAPWLAAGLALPLVFVGAAGFRPPTAEHWRHYVRTPLSHKYPVDAVHFLADTGVEGRLFTRYGWGAFYGYWLAPRLRTAVNGTLNFPDAVFADYFAVVNGGGASPEESFRETLARFDADLFVGEGMPEELRGAKHFYTTVLLERDPDWILVYRRPDTAIYLRRSERNRENLGRIEAYYARAGLRFDRERGLDLASILWAQSGAAVKQRMLPAHFPQLLADSESGEPQRAHRALSQLGALHLLLGDYAVQIQIDRRALALAPRHQGARRRLIFGLLRMGRIEEALAVARTMAAAGGPNNPVAAIFLRAVELEQALGDDATGVQIEAARRSARRLPVMQRGRYAREIEASMLPRPELGPLRR